jgi:hypothetical protein
VIARSTRCDHCQNESHGSEHEYDAARRGMLGRG